MLQIVSSNKEIWGHLSQILAVGLVQGCSVLKTVTKAIVGRPWSGPAVYRHAFQRKTLMQQIKQVPKCRIKGFMQEVTVPSYPIKAGLQVELVLQCLKNYFSCFHPWCYKEQGCDILFAFICIWNNSNRLKRRKSCFPPGSQKGLQIPQKDKE